MTRHHRFHTSNKTRITGILILLIGAPACMVVGALLWGVSPELSRIVGLYLTLTVALVGLVLSTIDSCGSWIEFWFRS